MNALRIGSMCTGYGGLDMAVQRVFGGEVAWHAEVDPDASKVLAHRYPSVPNLGDITAVRWQDATRVDLVCAGFPCQDLSYAGCGEGIQQGNRSGLWHTVADALGVLRPGLVVLENVAAIVGRRPGLDVVLADLARLGFDADWTCVRASDVGAPHQRHRWFLRATAADTMRTRQRRQRPSLTDRWPVPAPTAPADAAGRSDTHQQGHSRPPIVVTQPGSGGGDRPRSHARRAGGAGDDPSLLAWGPYEPAIRRWEAVLGRPAPRPTEPGRTGERLSPRFVEWLMGLPAGHVTDVPGVSRNAQLRLLGNGVVPDQAASGLVELERRAAA